MSTTSPLKAHLVTFRSLHCLSLVDGIRFMRNANVIHRDIKPQVSLLLLVAAMRENELTMSPCPPEPPPPTRYGVRVGCGASTRHSSLEGRRLWLCTMAPESKHGRNPLRFPVSL